MTQQLPFPKTFGGGEYESIRSLGEGGFAEVFLVKDRSGQQKALKQLRASVIANDSRVLERFAREVQYQKGLRNSHIASIEDTNSEEGYIVIEYIEGKTLKEFLKEKFEFGMDLDTDLDTLLEILQQLEIALKYLHDEVELAHLDLTPNNILIQNKHTLLGGTKLHVMLIDFGLARILNKDGWARVTDPVGTPGYESPEQRGLIADNLSKRSDIYTLGVVIGVMLTGRRPDEVLEILKDSSEELPIEMKRAFKRATAQDPRGRYSSVKSLIADFRKEIGNYQARKQREELAISSDPDRTQLAPLMIRSSARQSSRRLLMLGSPIRPQRIVLISAIVVVPLLILGWQLSAFIIPSPAPQPMYTTPLGGLDLRGYCTYLGYEQMIGELTCSSPINLDEACDWQWHEKGLRNEYDDPTNPYSGVCLDSQGKTRGGISQMGEYCQQKYHNMPTAVPSALGVSASWTCQQKINPTLVCKWQYGKTDVEARNGPSGWTCYATSK